MFIESFIEISDMLKITPLRIHTRTHTHTKNIKYHIFFNNFC